MENNSVLLMAPALEPPPGVTPNFVNPASTQGLFVPLSAVCVFLSSAFVAMRIGTRLKLKKPLEWEDCMKFDAPIQDRHANDR